MAFDLSVFVEKNKPTTWTSFPCEPVTLVMSQQLHPHPPLLVTQRKTVSALPHVSPAPRPENRARRRPQACCPTRCLLPSAPPEFLSTMPFPRGRRDFSHPRPNSPTRVPTPREPTLDGSVPLVSAGADGAHETPSSQTRSAWYRPVQHHLPHSTVRTSHQALAFSLSTCKLASGEGH